MIDVILLALFLPESVAVTVTSFVPSTRPCIVTFQVVANGYVTVPGVANVLTATLTNAPSSIVPDTVWLPRLVGVVTGSILTAGGTASFVMITVSETVFPALSVAVTVIVFAPGARFVISHFQDG